MSIEMEFRSEDEFIKFMDELIEREGLSYAYATLFDTCWEKSKQLEKAKAVIRKQREGIKFYSIERNWITRIIGVADLVHEKDLEQLPLINGHADWNIGGKLARQIKQETSQSIRELLREKE